jgi:hypothetical protein
MPKDLEIKTVASRKRKLTEIRIQISPYTREVEGRFHFEEVTEYSDGTKEAKPGGSASATEADLAPFLTDAMWDSVSRLAHGLADAQGA